MNYYKKALLIFLIFNLLFSANVNFLIDTDDEFGAVWVTGTFDGWTGWGLELINGDNIWTGSMILPNGNYEYVILGVDTDTNFDGRIIKEGLISRNQINPNIKMESYHTKRNSDGILYEQELEVSVLDGSVYINDTKVY